MIVVGKVLPPVDISYKKPFVFLFILIENKGVFVLSDGKSAPSPDTYFIEKAAYLSGDKFERLYNSGFRSYIPFFNRGKQKIFVYQPQGIEHNGS